MKVISRLVIVLGAMGMLASLPASAVCADASLFGSGYFSGTNDDATQAIGAFWGVGQYNPATSGGAGTGTDNGACQSNGTGCNALPWIRGGKPYIAGDWAGDSIYDHCIQSSPNPQPSKMVVAFSMPSSTPGGTAYAAVCNVEVSDNFSFGPGFAVDVPAGQVPKPVVQSTSRTATSVTANFSPPALGGGILDEAACGLSIGSYKVYRRSLAPDSPAPADRGRVSGGWTQVGGTFAATDPASATVDCTSAADVYFAYGLIVHDGLGSQYELEHVGTNSSVVRCNSTAAIAPNNFKIIKKPVRTKTK
jgi:hypothetical protein